MPHRSWHPRPTEEGEFNLPAGQSLTIMPNHLEIARQFSISDNFYCDSDASFHGHCWMVGTYPNEFVEANSSTVKTMNLQSTAPGRKYVAGSSGAVYPEDYNEAGGLWEHLARNGVEFYNFGLGFEFAASDQSPAFAETGVRMLVSFPLPRALYSRTSRTYATYNMGVPDQYRIDEFEREMDERFFSGAEPFPRLITMMIPNAGSNGATFLTPTQISVRSSRPFIRSSTFRPSTSSTRPRVSSPMYSRLSRTFHLLRRSEWIPPYSIRTRRSSPMTGALI